MARYRKIDTRIWSDAKFRKLSDNGKLLWFYLLTNQSTTSLPGLYKAGKASICEDLDWNPKGFQEGFQELLNKGLARVDWDSRLMWIPNAIKYNPPENPNVVKGWRAAWDELPECELKLSAFLRFEEFLKGFSKGFQKAFYQACPKGMANQDQDQDQEQEQDQDSFERDDEGAIDQLSGPDLPGATNGKSLHRVAKKSKAKKSTETEAPDLLEADAATVTAALKLSTVWESHWEDCRDWHRANGKKKVDWNATLRNWMKREPQKYPLTATSPQTGLAFNGQSKGSIDGVPYV